MPPSSMNPRKIERSQSEILLGSPSSRVDYSRPKFIRLIGVNSCWTVWAEPEKISKVLAFNLFIPKTQPKLRSKLNISSVGALLRLNEFFCSSIMDWPLSRYLLPFSTKSRFVVRDFGKIWWLVQGESWKLQTLFLLDGQDHCDVFQPSKLFYSLPFH